MLFQRKFGCYALVVSVYFLTPSLNASAQVTCYVDDEMTCTEAMTLNGSQESPCTSIPCETTGDRHYCNATYGVRFKQGVNIDWVDQSTTHPNRLSGWASFYPPVVCYEGESCDTEEECVGKCSGNDDWSDFSSVQPRAAYGYRCADVE